MTSGAGFQAKPLRKMLKAQMPTDGRTRQSSLLLRAVQPQKIEGFGLSLYHEDQVDAGCAATNSGTRCHDVECDASGLGEAGASERSANGLVVMAAGTKKVAEFAVLYTEAGGVVVVLEASHTSNSALDAAMVLFKAVVQVGTGPVPDRCTQHAADRPWVGSMAVRCDPIWTISHGRSRRLEECLRRLHVAVLAEHRIDQVSVPADRQIEAGPATGDLPRS